MSTALPASSSLATVVIVQACRTIERCRLEDKGLITIAGGQCGRHSVRFLSIPCIPHIVGQLHYSSLTLTMRGERIGLFGGDVVASKAQTRQGLKKAGIKLLVCSFQYRTYKWVLDLFGGKD